MPDANKRQRLLQIIMDQPEHDEGCALVSREEFFDGNDDLGSIGCNLPDHPGLDTFRRVIERMAALAAVDQVWLQFYDTHEGEWPFSENVLIFGEAALSEVAAHAAAIEPTEVQELSLDWTPSRDPALHDRRHVNLWWD